MKHAFLKNTLALATAAMLSASAAAAATFALDTQNGTATTLPTDYDLAVPAVGYDIFSFAGDGTGDFGSFGGLQLLDYNDNTRLTFTYLGSEAGASNSASLVTGTGSFSNDGSTAVGASFMTEVFFDEYVDLIFSTDNLGGSDFINNRKDYVLRFPISPVRRAM